MVLSAGFVEAGLAAVVVVAEAPGVEVVCSVVDAQLESNTATHATSPTYRAWEPIIVAATALSRVAGA
jgi:hypothetical protein